jgi:hypothetical protein
MSKINTIADPDGHRKAFFDTYKTPAVVTVIMGITPEDRKAIEQVQKVW